MADVKPNHTLYINNLNEKVKKDGKYRADHRTSTRERDVAWLRGHVILQHEREVAWVALSR